MRRLAPACAALAVLALSGVLAGGGRAEVPPVVLTSLKVSLAGTTGGTVKVTPTPTRVPRNDTCAARAKAAVTCTFEWHESPVAVTLKAATTSSGVYFSGWGGACAAAGTSPECSLTVTGKDVNVEARFDHTYVVNVVRGGNSQGRVVSEPTGLDCGVTCQVSFRHNEPVTLRALPAEGSAFTGWSGACVAAGTSPACTVTVTNTLTVGASFGPLAVPLTVTVGGAGGGSVTSDPGGIDCGKTCSASFWWGSAVTLRAVADPGSSFSGWSGACAGTTSAVCTTALKAASDVGATFASLPRVSVALVGNGRGTVSSAPGGIACGTGCTAPFRESRVTLVATPARGSRFVRWGGDCATAKTSRSCTVSVTEDAVVEARFDVACIVPRIVGRTLASAKRALAAAHCRLGTVGRRYSRVKLGLVAAQNPSAGAVRASGARVSVVLSRGRR